MMEEDESTINAHATDMGQIVLDEAIQEAWTFGPCPDTGPTDMDTGEEILLSLARLACLIPMQQARLQMMEIPERERTAQRRWLKALDLVIRDQGTRAGFRMHQLRKLGYSRKTHTV